MVAVVAAAAAVVTGAGAGAGAGLGFVVDKGLEALPASCFASYRFSGYVIVEDTASSLYLVHMRTGLEGLLEEVVADMDGPRAVPDS